MRLADLMRSTDSGLRPPGRYKEDVVRRCGAMKREEIAALLRLRDSAYAFVLELGTMAKEEPELLNKETAERLLTRTGCRDWLDAHWDRIPGSLQPVESERDAFSNLVWSFFQVSFRIDTLEWAGATLDADVRTGSRTPTAGIALRRVKMDAIRRLCRDRGLAVDERSLKDIVKHEDVRTEVSLWTYVWELRQRAKGKAKGRTLHRLWRSMPFEVRKGIDVDRAMLAADQVLAALGKEVPS